VRSNQRGKGKRGGLNRDTSAQRAGEGVAERRKEEWKRGTRIGADWVRRSSAQRSVRWRRGEWRRGANEELEMEKSSGGTKSKREPWTTSQKRVGKKMSTTAEIKAGSEGV